MKRNAHIWMIVAFVIGAIILSLYIGYDTNTSQSSTRFAHDSAAINSAHRTYERIHHEQQMEDPDYAELYNENEMLKERLQNIQDYAEQLDNDLFDIEVKGIDVSDCQDYVQSIIDECDY